MNVEQKRVRERRLKSLGLCVSDEVFREFRRIAWDEGRSMGRVAGELVENYVREYDEKDERR